MLKYGLISGSDPNKGLFRVNFDGDDIVSPWMPRIVFNTLNSKDEIPFDNGEHVACLMDEHNEAGVILGAIYNDENAPSVRNRNVRSTTYSDGTVIKYDTQNKVLTVSAAGKIIIQTGSGSEVDLTCSKLSVTGDLAVIGKITATTGIESNGDVKAAASSTPISLLTHKHTAPPGGGATGPAIP